MEGVVINHALYNIMFNIMIIAEVMESHCVFDIFNDLETLHRFIVCIHFHKTIIIIDIPICEFTMACLFKFAICRFVDNHLFD